MKVIFIQSVKNVGDVGDVKEVANGYAQNFLLPKKFAKRASAELIAELSKQKQQQKKKLGKQLGAAKEVQNKLSGLKIKIMGKAATTEDGQSGKLFAAVTADLISDTLKEKGFVVPAKQIVLPQPIKETGEYVVEAKLAGTTVSFSVVISAMK